MDPLRLTEKMTDLADTPPSRLRTLGLLTAVALSVALSAWVGIELTREAGRVASIWLANGLLLGVLLLNPRSQWVAYCIAGYVGNVAANVFTGDDLVTALLLSACNSLEVLLAAWALHSRLQTTHPLTTPRELAHFTFWAGGIAPLLSGLCASFYLSAQSPASPWDILQVWYPADALGIFIVTPLMLAFRLQRVAQTRHHRLEFAALLLLVALVTLGVFYQNTYPLLFLIYTPLFFIVLRHGQIGAVGGIAAITAIAIGMTVLQFGSFTLATSGAMRERILILQIFLAVASVLAYGASVMLAQRERLEHSVQRSLAEIEQIYRHTPVGLFAFDRDLRFLRINEQMAEINGVPMEAHLGRTIHEVVPQIAPQVVEMARRVLAKGAPLVNHELTGRTAKQPDTDRDWIVNYHPLRSHEGAILGLFGAVLEITERKQAERELARRVTQLERLNADIERFNYVVSHDLQSPLRNISSFAGLIERRLAAKLTDTERGLLAEISGCAKDMREMVQDLLRHSRVTPKLAEFAAVDTAVICADAIALLQADIAAADAQISCDPLPTLDGDARMLTQLFQNLISNAIKFQAQGMQPNVHIGAVQHGQEWEFSVADNGIGINADSVGSLFKVFQRLNAGSYSGTGIGLAICKRVVDIHGGRIWVDSTPGQGSCFRFTLPIGATITNTAVD